MRVGSVVIHPGPGSERGLQIRTQYKRLEEKHARGQLRGNEQYKEVLLVCKAKSSAL